jgi:alginate O-acetyltransferase complex protein AlgI
MQRESGHLLFNSFLFLLAFLPIALLTYWLADPWPRLRIPVLLLLSLVFYGWWDPRLLFLLAGSIGVNWLAARAFVATGRRWLITGAIVLDLALLALFKYANFLMMNAAALIGLTFAPMDIILPLGISFFTFHHIMYLVDLRKGRVALAPLDRYALYICFFPQAIAGPLARWSEVGHQFGQRVFAAGWEPRFALGIAMIVLGLVQKVIFGDLVGVQLNPIYEQARTGIVTNGGAWLALGFAFQIFFDFSGYSDIAIGLGLMLGVRLPPNFEAPLRAPSILMLWQRWHMTLTRFLRDYVLMSLANLKITARRHMAAQYCVAMVVTMALCGLWHGAGWPFVLWGTVQGVAMVVALTWRRRVGAPWAFVGWVLTVGFFMVTAVLFRSASFHIAWNIWAGLAYLPSLKLLARAWIVLLAAALAVSLPPTRALAEWLVARPSPIIPAALGLATIAILVLLGGNESYEFIYFQF